MLIDRAGPSPIRRRRPYRNFRALQEYGCMISPQTVLGIETSCDETAAAIVRGAAPGPGQILSNVIADQFADHKPFGGVVPEIAARAHVSRIEGVTRTALEGVHLSISDIDAVAVTAGPGLIGGVAAGLMFAKGLALAAQKPLIAVNHLAAHALTVRLIAHIPFPYVLLLVSGGHCQILAVEGADRFTRLGTTIDDAAGEAFDKTAKLLGLGYPGGPHIEAAALTGNPRRFSLPRPLLDQGGLNFSFSGLKTAVRRIVDAHTSRDPAFVADMAASFQAAVMDILADRSRRAMSDLTSSMGDTRHFVVAGGVAANQALRRGLEQVAAEQGYAFHVAPVHLCTDNAAMVAWAGIELIAAGRSGDPLDVSPRARWPLDARFDVGRGAKA